MKTTFVDGNPVQSILGTPVMAAFLNALNNHRHGGTAVDGDGALDYAIATGNNNAYAVTLSPALAANIAGMPIRFQANFSNTGAATLNVNGIGAIALKKAVNVALAAGDLQSGQIYTVSFDGTNYQVLEIILAGLGAANLKLFMNAAGIAAEWSNGLNFISFTRVASAVDGNVSYTGMGFKPSALIALSLINSTNSQCIGFANSARASIGNLYVGSAGWLITASSLISSVGPTLNYEDCSVASYDADGFTLTWHKNGSPTGTIAVYVLGIR
jgi:hypothetical protein